MRDYWGQPSSDGCSVVTITVVIFVGFGILWLISPVFAFIAKYQVDIYVVALILIFGLLCFLNYTDSKRKKNSSNNTSSTPPKNDDIGKRDNTINHKIYNKINDFGKNQTNAVPQTSIITSTNKSNSVKNDYVATWKDVNGCEYSKDWKTLLKGCNRETYTVREGTINIAEKAFKGFDKLVSIFIPPSLKTIEAEAFRGCKALKTICNYGYETSNNLGSVKRIGYRAFAECSNLNKISLNGIKELGACAFECSNIESIDLSNNLQKLEDGTFCFCRNLRAIYLPMNLNYIGSGCFSGCTYLEYVYLPWCDDNTFTICKGIFNLCPSLRKIVIPSDSLDRFDKLFSEIGYNIRKGLIEHYDDICLYWDYCDEPIHISDFRAQHGEESVIEFYGSNQFQHRFCFKDGTTALFSLNLEEGYVEKAYLYIRKCRNQGSNEIGYVAYNDRGIDISLNLDNSNSKWHLDEGYYSSDGLTILQGNYSFYNFDIFKGTKFIADKAFCDFYDYGIEYDSEECLIERIVIPSSVERIGSSPFGSNLNTLLCRSKHFIVEKSTLFTSDYKRMIQCFDKKNTGEYIIPDSVEEIGDLAFYCCKFKKIVIEKSVKKIGNNPFVRDFADNMSGCEIVCKSDLFSYREKALFYAKKKLIAYLGDDTNFIIPEGTEEIGNYAFRYCKFSTLLLPESLIKIDEKAFNNLSVSRIVVPKGSKEKYALLPRDFKDIIVE